jgi:hypothetical protein
MRMGLAWLAVASISISSAAQAQSSGQIGIAQQEMRIGVGLTIPLGGRDAPATRPQVELSLTRDRVDYRGGRRSQSVDYLDRQQLRIGRSLDADGAWSINGRPLPRDESGERRGISTLGAVGIGIGVFLVAGAIAVAIDPPLNDLFESNR